MCTSSPPSPAAWNIGVAYARMVFSVSASRIKEIRCAAAGSEYARTAATTSASAAVRRLRTPITLLDSSSPADSPRRSWQKCAAALLVAIVAGCGGSNQPGVIEPVEGFFGGISADEPRAAIAGRDVLIAGGSAVDAVVAMGFTLAVTLPSSAGLGGGGACVTFDGRTVTPTHFDFPATTAGGSRIAIPALVRGLALVHARYGRIAWSQLLGPAESAARFGTPVSRALAHDLALAPAELTRDSATARIFAPNGTLIREGDLLVQLDLATILGQLRQRGAGEFYLGTMPRMIAEASEGTLPLEALRGYLPQVTAPPVIRISSQQQFVIVGESPHGGALRPAPGARSRGRSRRCRPAALLGRGRRGS